MKQDNINYTVVGSFVIAMGLLLLVILYFITGRVADSDQYFTVLDEIPGLNNGSSVTYKGYRVGQLINIDPVYKDNKTQFKLTLAVKSGWKITKGSTVTIAKPGLLSDSQINIIEGGLQEVLSVGSEIEGVPANDIITVMKSLTQKLKDDVGSFTSGMTKQLPELMTNLNLLVIKLHKSSDVIDAFFSDNNQQSVSVVIEKAESMMLNLDAASKVINKLVVSNEDHLDGSVDKINSSISMINEKLEIIVNQFEMSSRNINDFSNQIKNNPGMIIRNKSVSDPAVR